MFALEAAAEFGLAAGVEPAGGATAGGDWDGYWPWPCPVEDGFGERLPDADPTGGRPRLLAMGAFGRRRRSFFGVGGFAW